MEGGISLKDFILGVKKELQEASAEGSKNPFLELAQVELEAEFGLDAEALAEGGFKFLVRVGGKASASQSHKVKLVFSPIKSSLAFAISPSDATEYPSPFFPSPSSPEQSGRPTPHGPYVFHVPGEISRTIDIDELVEQALLKSQLSKLKEGGSGGEGA